MPRILRFGESPRRGRTRRDGVLRDGQRVEGGLVRLRGGVHSHADAPADNGKGSDADCAVKEVPSGEKDLPTAWGGHLDALLRAPFGDADRRCVRCMRRTRAIARRSAPPRALARASLRVRAVFSWSGSFRWHGGNCVISPTPRARIRPIATINPKTNLAVRRRL